MKELFERDVRYLVPLYQRPYVWDARHQWGPLWEDVEAILDHRLGGAGDGFSHFLGAIVLDQEQNVPGGIPRYTLIDGQQRLTTLQLLISAASKVAADRGAHKEAAILRRLTRNDELIAEGVEVYKVWPTNANRAAFQAVVQDGGPSADREDDAHNRIDEAFAFFEQALGEWLDEQGDTEAQSEGVKHLRVTLSDLLRVVSITLESNDNAQIIFETLNARGTPLLALDLVKNAVFHAAERQGLDIDALYHGEWEPELDQTYWRTEKRQGRLNRPRADLFLMHWLAMKLRDIVPATELFPSFRQRVLDASPSPAADELIREIRRDAKLMRSFDDQPAGSPEAVFFDRLERLDTTVVLPLVLLLFRDSRITQDRRRRALRILESWLVRRSLMRLTPKNYNQQIPVMLTRVGDDPEHADDVLLEHLRSGVGEISRWPADEELVTHLTTRPLYNSVGTKRIVMALAAVEASLYTSKVDLPDVPKTLSLEHVLPQSWSEHWPLAADGDPVELRERRDQKLHLLGNLTLTTGELNAALSNAPWVEKRAALNKYAKLLLNVELIDEYPEAFDEDAIDERGARIAERICAIWPGPTAWKDGEAAYASSENGTAIQEASVVERPEAGEGTDESSSVREYADLLSRAVPEGEVDVVHGRPFGARARLNLPGAETVRYAYADDDSRGEFTLRLYPAVTLEQARLLYMDPLRCSRLLALRDNGWDIEPNFHFGFMAKGLTWTRSELATDDYLRYWQERIDRTGVVPRERWDEELELLIEAGIFAREDEVQFATDFRNTDRGSATPRPSLAVCRRWSRDLVAEPDFPLQLRNALREILGALQESTSWLGPADSQSRAGVTDG